VQKDKRGYLRLVRRVNGKVLALHVGRSWDEDKAREKIAQLPTH
jgi:hypothetical protein